MSKISKDATATLFDVNKLCEELGVDFSDFMKSCKVIYGFKRFNEEALDKVEKAAVNMRKYVKERAAILKIDANLVPSNEDNFLAHVFQYCLSKEEKLDKSFGEYISYCNVHYLMYDPKEMEDLSKAVAKKMKLTSTPKDKSFYADVVAALPKYEEDHVPTGKVQTAITTFYNNVKSVSPDMFNVQKARSLMLSDARQEYSSNDSEFSIEFFARHEANAVRITSSKNFTLVSQLDHYIIATVNGEVLYDTKDREKALTELSNVSSEWHESRKQFINEQEVIDLSRSDIFVVMLDDSTVLIATTSEDEKNEEERMLKNGVQTPEWIKRRVIEVYGFEPEKSEALAKAIVSHYGKQYDLSKFKDDPFYQLYGITPLIQAGVENF